RAHKGCGVVFKITKDRTFTVLHTFAGGADGAIPRGGLLLDKNGILFGAAAEGGFAQNGTIYEISSDGVYTILHRFTNPEGQNPNGGLGEDESGKIFGTTQQGGDQTLGTVFELSPEGSVHVLHNFQGLEDGARPLAGLFRDSAGHLYGTTPRNFLLNHVQGGG